MKWVEAPHFLKDDVIADVPRLLILGKKIYSLCYYEFIFTLQSSTVYL